MSAPPPAPPAFPPMDSSIGAFVVGTILSVFLAGVTCVQALEYYEQFWRKDRRWIVATVSFLLGVDLFHTAITCYTIYLWTVTNYGNLLKLVHSPWSFTWDPFLTGLVALVVQLFYAYRVFVVSQRKWFLPAAIGVLSFLQFAFATGSTWKIYLLDSEFARFGEFRYGVAIWLLSAAVADILITGSLIYYLRKASGGDHQRSSSIVRRICTVSIETNGLTCLFAIADAILFVAMPADSWHVIPNLSLVKLYYNGLLASLNCRRDFTASPRPTQAGYSDYGHGTPAPKYSAAMGSSPSTGSGGGQTMSTGSSPNPNLITPQTLETQYASKAGSGEKRGVFDAFRRNKARTSNGDEGSGVRVTMVHETTSGSSSHGDTDIEKGIDRDTAQAFELSTVAHQHQPHSANNASDGAVTIPIHISSVSSSSAVPPVPPVPAVHPYAASATPDAPRTPAARPNPVPPVAPHSMGMAGAIPREWQ
ncbi:hypothetical protein JCM6882_004706 [Rhodosporidiobolus microsporus]